MASTDLGMELQAAAPPSHQETEPARVIGVIFLLQLLATTAIVLVALLVPKSGIQLASPLVLFTTAFTTLLFGLQRWSRRDAVTAGLVTLIVYGVVAVADTFFLFKAAPAGGLPLGLVSTVLVRGMILYWLISAVRSGTRHRRLRLMLCSQAGIGALVLPGRPTRASSMSRLAHRVPPLAVLLPAAAIALVLALTLDVSTRRTAAWLYLATRSMVAVYLVVAAVCCIVALLWRREAVSRVARRVAIAALAPLALATAFDLVLCAACLLDSLSGLFPRDLSDLRGLLYGSSSLVLDGLLVLWCSLVSPRPATPWSGSGEPMQPSLRWRPLFYLLALATLVFRCRLLVLVFTDESRLLGASRHIVHRSTTEDLVYASELVVSLLIIVALVVGFTLLLMASRRAAQVWSWCLWCVTACLALVFVAHLLATPMLVYHGRSGAELAPLLKHLWQLTLVFIAAAWALHWRAAQQPSSELAQQNRSVMAGVVLATAGSGALTATRSLASTSLKHSVWAVRIFHLAAAVLVVTQLRRAGAFFSGQHYRYLSDTLFELTLVDLVAGALVIFTILKGLRLYFLGRPGLAAFWVTSLGRGALLWGSLVVFRCTVLLVEGFYLLIHLQPACLWLLAADIGKVYLCLVLKRRWQMV